MGVATSRSLGSLFDGGPIDTGFASCYAAQIQNQMDIVGAVGLNPPVVLELGNVDKVRVLIARCVGDSVVLELTSAAGVAQAVPLSGGGICMLFLPNLGDELLEIAVAGDKATVSYYVAGDVA